MIEIAQLAQDAMNALAPMLHHAEPLAGKAADGAATQFGKTIFEWLASQVKGKPAETTLERAVATPGNPNRLDALRLEIADLAENDPVFREQLAKLLSTASSQTTLTNTQTANPVGDGNKISQVIGSNNRTQIG